MNMLKLWRFHKNTLHTIHHALLQILNFIIKIKIIENFFIHDSISMNILYTLHWTI